MKFIELKKHLSQQKDACYLLSGDDPFVLSSAIKAFEAIVELPEMNLIRLESPTAADIVNAALVFPMMSPFRLIVVEKFEKDAEELKKYLLSPSETTVIVIVSPTVTKNLSGIPALTVVDCSRLDGSVILSYIARECNSGGVNISQPAAQLLIDSCNRFMSRISVELKKLIAYKKSGVISSEDVAKLVNADPEYKVFELGDCLASGKGERALTILDDMLGGGSVAGVFGIIYKHFRQLLYVAVTQNDDDVRRNLGVNEYALKRIRAQAKGFSPKQLKSICDRLHKVDSDYKSGLISDKLAITTFALQVVNEGRK
ncbi:MAG: DNA polymerase III subunit delta [Clostridia bacterium]|nr:DNA polymerase III subunit delta [Clostridiales bacterium]MBR2970742.1 DNA polymerase III subunit delta [Clostridia bacterium]